MSAPQTIIDKLWSAHEIVRREDGAALLFVDRHYVHEGSFLAFDQMRKRGRSVAEPTLTFGIADHYVPTRGRERPIADPSIADMVGQLERNTSANGIRLFGLGDVNALLAGRDVRSRRGNLRFGHQVARMHLIHFLLRNQAGLFL